MSEDNIIKFQGYTFDTFKEVTNRDRADIGEVALKAFIAAAGSSGEMDADIRDLICDLLHLARCHGLDPHTEVEGAIGMWSAEDRDPDTENNDTAVVTINEVTI